MSNSNQFQILITMYVRIYLSFQFASLCAEQQVTTVQETAVQVTKDEVMKGLTIIRIGDLKRQTQKKKQKKTTTLIINLFYLK